MTRVVEAGAVELCAVVPCMVLRGGGAWQWRWLCGVEKGGRGMGDREREEGTRGREAQMSAPRKRHQTKN